MNRDKHIWEGWTVDDFIDEIEPTFDWFDFFESLFNPGSNFTCENSDHSDTWEHFDTTVVNFDQGQFPFTAHDQYEEILNSSITLEEVENSIRNLKAGKSPGHDGIPPEFFKY